MPDSNRPAAVPTREDLLQRARDLVSVLRERAHRAELDRRVPDATQQAFVDAGLGDDRDVLIDRVCGHRGVERVPHQRQVARREQGLWDSLCP